MLGPLVAATAQNVPGLADVQQRFEAMAVFAALAHAGCAAATLHWVRRGGARPPGLAGCTCSSASHTPGPTSGQLPPRRVKASKADSDGAKKETKVTLCERCQCELSDVERRWGASPIPYPSR